MHNHSGAANVEHGIRIGENHGYRIDGDTVSLNADLCIVHDDAPPTELALQLWATDDPYEGGALRGFKIVEVPVALPTPTAGLRVRLEAESVAHLPESRREFAMTLVLAARDRAAQEEVHDFANYPNRQLFEIPYLEGTAGYSIEGATALLRVDAVHNPRPGGNLSGSLALELWALGSPLSHGALEGALMARAEIGQVSGQRSVGPLNCAAALSWPPAGRWHMALILREWTAAGWATRDFRNFDVPFDARPSHDEIALAAYFRCLARGGAPGHEIQDWLEAERDLLALSSERRSAA